MTRQRHDSNLLDGSEVVTVTTFLFNKKVLVCATRSILTRVTYFLIQSAHGLTEISSSNKRNLSESQKEKAYFRSFVGCLTLKMEIVRKIAYEMIFRKNVPMFTMQFIQPMRILLSSFTVFILKASNQSYSHHKCLGNNNVFLFEDWTIIHFSKSTNKSEFQS